MSAPAAAYHAAAATAVGHPLRELLLEALAGNEASPSELAELFREPIGKVAYHVRELLDAGAIRLVREERRRGAIEHYYVAVIRVRLDVEVLDG